VYNKTIEFIFCMNLNLMNIDKRKQRKEAKMTTQSVLEQLQQKIDTLTDQSKVKLLELANVMYEAEKSKEKNLPTAPQD
jgi:predicted  nucleic acid-binding Zn-ribbon protein